MAGSKGHVDERRLRPVYDALDNLNNRQAIKLAEAILKKQKECHCAKALKSLALIRSGRPKEALPHLDDVRAKADNLDDATLQAMTMCYKESFQPDGIVSIYELAVNQTKNNEEFLSHLFTAYVRVSNYAKQQQAAMNLYKAFPKNPYYFWAVMSNVMQGLAATDDKKRSMFLNLAERMVTKFIKDEKIEAEEEEQLYLMILELEGKWEELLKIIKDDDVVKCLGNERDERKVEYLTSLQRWPEVNVTYHKLLLKNPDDWLFIKGYLESFYHLKGYVADVPIDTDDEQPDFKEECVESFLSELSESHPSLRGPMIGLMELSKHCIVEENRSADILLTQAIAYFNRFGSKACCFNDLSQFIKLLNEEQQKEFVDQIRSNLKAYPEDSDLKTKVKHLWQEICIECFSRRLNLNKALSWDELFAKAKAYVKKYYDSLELGKDVNRTEQQHGDVLILLACYILLDLNNEKGDDSLVWHIVLILEEAAEKSPTNVQFKMFLMFLYYELGVSGACEKLIEEIEVKYIMYDSLGYFLCCGAYSSGQFQLTQRLYDATHAFYKASRKDIPEQIIASYKYGSFRQVTDMTSFRKRVENSANRAWVRVEQLYVDMMRFCNSANEAKKRIDIISDELESLNLTEITVNELFDNRDVNLFEHYDVYANEFTEENKKASFQQYILWLRYRFVSFKLLKKCLSGSSNSLHNGSQSDDEQKNNTKGRKSSIDVLLDEVEDIVAAFENFNAPDKWVTVHHPPPSPFVKIIQWKYHEVISNLSRSCSIISNVTEIDESNQSSITKLLGNTNTILQDNQTKILCKLKLRQGDSEMLNGRCLTNIVYFIEICNLSAVLLLALKESLKQKFGAGKGKKKKPLQQQQQQQPLQQQQEEQQEQPQQMLSNSDELMQQVKGVCKTIRDLLHTLMIQLREVKESCVDRTFDDKSIMELFEKTNSTVVTKIWDKVQTSYQQSVSEINQILSLKIKFFEVLQK